MSEPSHGDGSSYCTDRSSYYGQPIVRGPGWQAIDIAGYLYLGGLAGGSSLLAVGADLADMPDLSRRAKVTAAAAITASLAALVHDLGRPERFINMLRVVKPTSPMNVGSWLLAVYSPAAIAAAASSISGLAPAAGRAATIGAGSLAPIVASYTAVLLADTAVPAWHDAAGQLPMTFVGSAAMAAGGVALVVAPIDQRGPARRLGLLGWAVEVAALRRLRRRVGSVAEAYEEGRAGRWLRASHWLAVYGAAATLASWRWPSLARLGGLGLAFASAATRAGVFEAGRASADDPRFVVDQQRRRVAARGHG